MYLSRIELDISKRETMRALASPSIIHGMVESSFSGERKRRLWRIDRLHGNTFLLVLSEDYPDFHNLISQIGSDDNWETKNYDVLLDRLIEGTQWHFRLRANPIRKLSAEGTHGEIHAHITEQYQKMWLLERAKKYGFQLSEDTFEVVRHEWLIFPKPGQKRITILAVEYEGTLSITNVEAFKAMLTDGIGKGKAYGLGMMTIVR